MLLHCFRHRSDGQPHLLLKATQSCALLLQLLQLMLLLLLLLPGVRVVLRLRTRAVDAAWVTNVELRGGGGGEQWC